MEISLCRAVQSDPAHYEYHSNSKKYKPSQLTDKSYELHKSPNLTTMKIDIRDIAKRYKEMLLNIQCRRDLRVKYQLLDNLLKVERTWLYKSVDRPFRSKIYNREMLLEYVSIIQSRWFDGDEIDHIRLTSQVITWADYCSRYIGKDGEIFLALACYRMIAKSKYMDDIIQLEMFNLSNVIKLEAKIRRLKIFEIITIFDFIDRLSEIVRLTPTQFKFSARRCQLWVENNHGNNYRTSEVAFVIVASVLNGSKPIGYDDCVRYIGIREDNFNSMMDRLNHLIEAENAILQLCVD